MSFGKPKNPLTDVTNDVAQEYQLDKLEAALRGENYVMHCGCTFLRAARTKLVKRCSAHEKTTEFTFDPKKDRK